MRFAISAFGSVTGLEACGDRSDTIEILEAAEFCSAWQLQPGHLDLLIQYSTIK
jgi:hypothetical protein